MNILRRIVAFFARPQPRLPMGWANANRIENEHRQEMDRIRVEGIEAFADSQNRRGGVA